MKIKILAVGKLKKGPLLSLYEMYQERLKWLVSLEEIEGAGEREVRVQKAIDTKTLLAKIPEKGSPIFLDPHGIPTSSPDFAQLLDKITTTGRIPCFIIGGAEGLEPSLYPQHAQCLSFGPAIWPHLLARVMLMEQLYRAQEILAGGQYHRL